MFHNSRIRISSVLGLNLVTSELFGDVGAEVLTMNCNVSGFTSSLRTLLLSCLILFSRRLSTLRIRIDAMRIFKCFICVSGVDSASCGN